MSFLYDGVDHPLRVATTVIADIRNCAGCPPQPPLYEQSARAVAYYELDLAGNVRRLRALGGADLGGYRYSAFGRQLADTVTNPDPSFGLHLPNQPLRWKGMWRYAVGSTELYDARSRFWSPELGSFLSIDELEFHNPSGTFWAWPGQNPVQYADPFGFDGTTSNPIQDLVDMNLLPPGLTIFGKGARMRANGISMMANDATFEAGSAKAACGSAMMAAGAGVLGADAMVIAGAAEAAVGAATAIGRSGGPSRAVATSPSTPRANPPPAPGPKATFIGQQKGPSIAVPTGASGPVPTRSAGVQYVGGHGGQGLHPNVSNVRIMEPTPARGPSPGYPQGHASYSNSYGQTVNPYTGRPISTTDPWWHLPLGP